MQEDWSQGPSFRHWLGRCPSGGAWRTTAQHRAEGTSPLAPAPWVRKGRGGRKRTCVQNHKIAGLDAERLEVECQRPGSGQCPGSGVTGPNMVYRNGRAEEVCPHTQWPVHMPGIPRCCPVGEVTPAVLDSSLTSPPTAKLIPLRVLQQQASTLGL